MAAYLRLDVFPGTAVVNQTTVYTPARVIVTDDSVYVYMDSENGPTSVYSARLADYVGDRQSGEATSDEGDTVIISRASHCGCGSRLRGFHPFAGVPMMAQNR